MTNFIERDGEEVFKEEFLEFAGYNLQRRAIPDARDGLKWGARQLLYSQDLGGFTYKKPFKKAVKSVAQAMGYCYVHGDASAYGTFIRMAKPFAYRYVLQEANGNYGTLINPDDHSASRYVELRGSELAANLLTDIDKETIIEWEDTYDLEGQFPKVLPAKGFYGAVNGCISIGSGMSCSIPPTNLTEVNTALIKLLNNPNIDDDSIICYPDFPTGATILNRDEVKTSMLNGSGFACKVRASVEYDKKENCFIVKEMPYSTYTNTICNELATLMTEDENCGVVNFVDYTGVKPDLRIYLEKKANPDKVLKRLYKETSLQTHYTINMVMLDKGTTPRLFGWRDMLQAHLDHEKIVYRRGFEFDIRKLNDRKHILEGYLICLARIEEVVQTIKKSSSTTVAKVNLIKEYLLDDAQATAVLKLTLSRLAHLEIEKIEKEKDDIIKELSRLEAILADEKLLNTEIEKGLRAVMTKYGDERRTQILNIEHDGTDEPVEVIELQVSLTNKNNLYASKSSSLYTQKRGGTGSKFKMDAGEYIINTIPVKSVDNILFFTNTGNYYVSTSAAIPMEEKINAAAIVNCGDENIMSITSIDNNISKQYIIFITKYGMIKKSKLSEYNVTKNRAGGIKAINLDDGDNIVSILFTNDDKLGILTHEGNFIIVDSDPIRPIGRISKGIKGIKLSDTDYVVSGRCVRITAKSIISVSEQGYIKQTSMSEFSVQGTNTKGNKLQKLSESDYMADFLPINDHSEIFIGSTSAYIKFSVSEIPMQLRTTLGVKSIKLATGAKVIALN